LPVVAVVGPVLEPALPTVADVAAIYDRVAAAVSADREVDLGAIESVPGSPATEVVGAGGRRGDQQSEQCSWGC
jgi:hypothetical protein